MLSDAQRVALLRTARAAIVDHLRDVQPVLADLRRRNRHERHGAHRALAFVGRSHVGVHRAPERFLAIGIADDLNREAVTRVEQGRVIPPRERKHLALLEAVQQAREIIGGESDVIDW